MGGISRQLMIRNGNFYQLESITFAHSHMQPKTRWSSQISFICTPYLGERFPILTNLFSDGLKAATRKNGTLHPGRLTWNLQITHLERKMIFQTSMIMFHVNLQGCIFWEFWVVLRAPTPNPNRSFNSHGPRRWCFCCRKQRKNEELETLETAILERQGAKGKVFFPAVDGGWLESWGWGGSLLGAYWKLGPPKFWNCFFFSISNPPPKKKTKRIFPTCAFSFWGSENPETIFPARQSF